MAGMGHRRFGSCSQPIFGIWCQPHRCSPGLQVPSRSKKIHVFFAALCAVSVLSAFAATKVGKKRVPILQSSTASDSLPPLIPLEALFESPEIQWGGISPDGRWLSYMKPWHGHQNAFVRHVALGAERVVTRDSVRSIQSYWWSADGKRILWIQDRAGDENYHLYVARITDSLGNALDLTPFKNVEVEVVSLPAATPNTAIITMNNRDPALADAYRVDITMGTLDLAAINPGTFLGYVADRQNQVRAAYAVDSSGHYQLWARESERTPWRMVKSYAVEDRITPLRFASDGRLYATSNEGTDLSRLVLIELSSGKETVIDTDPLGESDIGPVFLRRADGRAVDDALH